VVDDEPQICRIVKSFLETRYDVTVAEGGPAALRTLSGPETFDCLVCDLMMKAVSGIDLHEWLMVRNPDLGRRTLFVTGGVCTEKVREALDRAGNRVLEKPFQAEALLALVHEMLDRGRSSLDTERAL
jgi:CheY-like chemotaxis protein